MKFLVTLFSLVTSQTLVHAQSLHDDASDRLCDGGAAFVKRVIPLAVLVAIPCLLPAQSLSIPWSGYGHDPQHTGTSATAAQPLNSIHWQTPVDLNPPGGGSGPLYVHYGSPVVTAGNTLIVPVGNGGAGFQLNAFNGATGAPIYTLTSDYSLPAHSWTPPYGPALALGTRLFYAGAGGTLYYRDLPNSATGPGGKAGATGQVAFYGMTGPNGYTANAATYNSAVQISTPLTADRSGNVYFGFTVTGATPAALVSGIAKVSYTGAGTWTSAVALTGDGNANQIALNCAPALNNTQTIVYVATSNGAEYGYGYLTSMTAAKLAPVSHVEVFDPSTGDTATVSTDSSASPMVGPDGDVYYGVLETPCCTSHHDRGWLLHFDSNLDSPPKVPGSFGWDDTASVVPAAAMPGYTGTSSYLILTKYNNYAETGGDGVNKVAVLDPSATQPDAYSSVTVLKEVITVTGVTGDPSNGGLPAVREWCINTAAIDPYTKSAIINSEDGTVYRWDFASNSLSQRMVLTSGRGEAYTPTVIGPDGTSYAVNDAILFAVGR
jgi:hypothetical protein